MYMSTITLSNTAIVLQLIGSCTSCTFAYKNRLRTYQALVVCLMVPIKEILGTEQQYTP